MHVFKKHIIFYLSVLFIVILFHPGQIHAIVTRPWQIESIDTMKYSRDAARDKTSLVSVPLFMDDIVKLHANYVAIDTPYDEEFYPVLSDWVAGARKAGLHVWFRGNFSSWEGWFGYPRLKNPDEDHVMVKQFILKHPDLFQRGDIFTPVPEAENGVIGDPRISAIEASRFNSFLITSYKNCVDSFQVIQKTVFCGYFSVNGDVARTILTANTVAKTGNVIVIDHYVSSPLEMGNEVDVLHRKFPAATIVLGEYGAPIPDINGDMSETQQAALVAGLLKELYIRRNIVTGVDYWTLAGGSTSLLNSDYSPRPVMQVVKGYYEQNVWQGKIIDAFNDPISYAHVYTDTNDHISVANGVYTIVTTAGSITIHMQLDGYEPVVQNISFDTQRYVSQSIVLTPLNPDVWYKLQLLWQKFFR